MHTPDGDVTGNTRSRRESTHGMITVQPPMAAQGHLDFEVSAMAAKGTPGGKCIPNPLSAMQLHALLRTHHSSQGAGRSRCVPMLAAASPGA